MRTASSIEAFRNPEQRGQLHNFGMNYQAFNAWLMETAGNTTKENVTPVTGSKLATVWGCLNILGQEVATLPFQVRQETDEGRKIIRNNIFRLINKKPNRLENAWQFWYGMVFLGEGWGNSYAYILRDGIGNPIELIRLKPWMVTPEIVEGDLYYVVNGQAIPSRDIFHYRSFVLDGPEGMSKIMYNADLMGLKMKQNRFAENSTGTKPPGFLRHEGAILKEQRKHNQESWENDIREGRTPLLYGGFDYKQVMMSAEAAEIVQMTEWTDTTTMSIWRIQPAMLSNHKNSNYSNAEQQLIAHAKFTLLPILTNIEQEADEKLFSERDKVSKEPHYTKFNIMGLLRGDMAAQAALISTLTTVGHINSDETREWFDWGPQKDENGKTGIGKKYYQQGAMMEKGKEMPEMQSNERALEEIHEILKNYKPSLNGHSK